MAGNSSSRPADNAAARSCCRSTPMLISGQHTAIGMYSFTRDARERPRSSPLQHAHAEGRKRWERGGDTRQCVARRGAAVPQHVPMPHPSTPDAPRGCHQARSGGGTNGSSHGGRRADFGGPKSTQQRMATRTDRCSILDPLS
jgi:hypothetical protein